MNFCKLSIVLVLTLGGLSFSCEDDDDTSGASNISCNGVVVGFAADVKPIIDSRCATSSGCHGSGSNVGPGALTTYTQVFQARTQIKTAVSSGIMPKGSSLNTGEKASIVCWIEGGAANN